MDRFSFVYGFWERWRYGGGGIVPEVGSWGVRHDESSGERAWALSRTGCISLAFSTTRGIMHRLRRVFLSSCFFFQSWEVDAPGPDLARWYWNWKDI
jgi:hypothetical protein